MAVTSFHKPTGRWLTTSHGWAAGQTVHLTQNSFAYDSAIAAGSSFADGRPSSLFTLGEPIATNERGQPLWDLDDCDHRCPLDGSPQFDAKGHRGSPSSYSFLREDLRPSRVA